MTTRLRQLFLYFALACLPSLFAQEDDIRWHDNYASALREAKQTGKPIFLEFRCEP